MNDTIVAAVQMISGANVAENLSEAKNLILEAADQGAELIVLPENFALMGVHETDKLSVSESHSQGPIQDFLSETAARHKIWLVGGTIPIKAMDKKVRATTLIYDAEGHRVGRYDKIHLFDVHVPGTEESYLESATIEAGDEMLIINSPAGRLGFSVCYDIRFPELFRRMALDGMDLFVVPSAFTEQTGAAHWEVLIRARAIENQCYVIAANQGGRHENGRQTYGHSMIVDPWGNVLACLPKGRGTVIAQIDHARLDSIRNNFPALRHQRLLMNG